MTKRSKSRGKSKNNRKRFSRKNKKQKGGDVGCKAAKISVDPSLVPPSDFIDGSNSLYGNNRIRKSNKKTCAEKGPESEECKNNYYNSLMMAVSADLNDDKVCDIEGVNLVSLAEDINEKFGKSGNKVPVATKIDYSGNDSFATDIMFNNLAKVADIDTNKFLNSIVNPNIMDEFKVCQKSTQNFNREEFISCYDKIGIRWHDNIVDNKFLLSQYLTYLSKQINIYLLMSLVPSEMKRRKQQDGVSVMLIDNLDPNTSNIEKCQSYKEEREDIIQSYWHSASTANRIEQKMFRCQPIPEQWDEYENAWNAYEADQSSENTTRLEAAEEALDACPGEDYWGSYYVVGPQCHMNWTSNISVEKQKKSGVTKVMCPRFRSWQEWWQEVQKISETKPQFRNCTEEDAQYFYENACAGWEKQRKIVWDNMSEQDKNKVLDSIRNGDSTSKPPQKPEGEEGVQRFLAYIDSGVLSSPTSEPIAEDKITQEDQIEKIVEPVNNGGVLSSARSWLGFGGSKYVGGRVKRPISEYWQMKGSGGFGDKKIGFSGTQSALAVGNDEVLKMLNKVGQQQTQYVTAKLKQNAWALGMLVAQAKTDRLLAYVPILNSVLYDKKEDGTANMGFWSRHAFIAGNMLPLANVFSAVIGAGTFMSMETAFWVGAALNPGPAVVGYMTNMAVTASSGAIGTVASTMALVNPVTVVAGTAVGVGAVILMRKQLLASLKKKCKDASDIRSYIAPVVVGVTGLQYIWPEMTGVARLTLESLSFSAPFLRSHLIGKASSSIDMEMGYSNLNDIIKTYRYRLIRKSCLWIDKQAIVKSMVKMGYCNRIKLSSIYTKNAARRGSGEFDDLIDMLNSGDAIFVNENSDLFESYTKYKNASDGTDNKSLMKSAFVADLTAKFNKDNTLLSDLEMLQKQISETDPASNRERWIEIDGEINKKREVISESLLNTIVYLPCGENIADDNKKMKKVEGPDATEGLLKKIVDHLQKGEDEGKSSVIQNYYNAVHKILKDNKTSSGKDSLDESYYSFDDEKEENSSFWSWFRGTGQSKTYKRLMSLSLNQIFNENFEGKDDKDLQGVQNCLKSCTSTSNDDTSDYFQSDAANTCIYGKMERFTSPLRNPGREDPFIWEWVDYIMKHTMFHSYTLSCWKDLDEQKLVDCRDDALTLKELYLDIPLWCCLESTIIEYFTKESTGKEMKQTDYMGNASGSLLAMIYRPECQKKFSKLSTGSLKTFKLNNFYYKKNAPSSRITYEDAMESLISGENILPFSSLPSWKHAIKDILKYVLDNYTSADVSENIFARYKDQFNDEAIKDAILDEILSQITSLLLNRYLHFEKKRASSDENVATQIGNKHITSINEYCAMCVQYAEFDKSHRIVDATNAGLSIYEQICLNLDAFNYLFGLVQTNRNKQQTSSTGKTSITAQEDSPLAIRDKMTKEKNNRLLITGCLVVGATFVFHAAQTVDAKAIRKYLWSSTGIGGMNEAELNARVKDAEKTLEEAQQQLNSSSTALNEANKRFNDDGNFQYDEAQHDSMMTELKTCAAKTDKFQQLMSGDNQRGVEASSNAYLQDVGSGDHTGAVKEAATASEQYWEGSVSDQASKFIITTPGWVSSSSNLSPEADALHNLVQKKAAAAAAAAAAAGTPIPAWVRQAQAIMAKGGPANDNSGENLKKMFSNLVFYLDKNKDKGIPDEISSQLKALSDNNELQGALTELLKIMTDQRRRKISCESAIQNADTLGKYMQWKGDKESKELAFQAAKIAHQEANQRLLALKKNTYEAAESELSEVLTKLPEGKGMMKNMKKIWNGVNELKERTGDFTTTQVTQAKDMLINNNVLTSNDFPTTTDWNQMSPAKQLDKLEKVLPDNWLAQLRENAGGGDHKLNQGIIANLKKIKDADGATLGKKDGDGGWLLFDIVKEWKNAAGAGAAVLGWRAIYNIYKMRNYLMKRKDKKHIKNLHSLDGDDAAEATTEFIANMCSFLVGELGDMYGQFKKNDDEYTRYMEKILKNNEKLIESLTDESYKGVESNLRERQQNILKWNAKSNLEKVTDTIKATTSVVQDVGKLAGAIAQTATSVTQAGQAIGVMKTFFAGPNMTEDQIRAKMAKNEFKKAKQAAEETVKKVKVELKNKETEYNTALDASNKVMKQLQETKTILAKQKKQLKELDEEIDIVEKAKSGNDGFSLMRGKGERGDTDNGKIVPTNTVMDAVHVKYNEKDNVKLLQILKKTKTAVQNNIAYQESNTSKNSATHLANNIQLQQQQAKINQLKAIHDNQMSYIKLFNDVDNENTTDQTFNAIVGEHALVQDIARETETARGISNQENANRELADALVTTEPRLEHDEINALMMKAIGSDDDDDDDDDDEGGTTTTNATSTTNTSAAPPAARSMLDAMRAQQTRGGAPDDIEAPKIDSDSYNISFNDNVEKNIISVKQGLIEDSINNINNISTDISEPNEKQKLLNEFYNRVYSIVNNYNDLSIIQIFFPDIPKEILTSIVEFEPNFVKSADQEQSESQQVETQLESQEVKTQSLSKKQRQKRNKAIKEISMLGSIDEIDSYVESLPDYMKADQTLQDAVEQHKSDINDGFTVVGRKGGKTRKKKNKNHRSRKKSNKRKKRSRRKKRKNKTKKN